MLTGCFTRCRAGDQVCAWSVGLEEWLRRNYSRRVGLSVGWVLGDQQEQTAKYLKLDRQTDQYLKVDRQTD